jgi:uncharacterized protein YcfL
LGTALLTATLAALTGCVETAGTTVTTDHTTGSTLVLEDSTRLKDQVQVQKVNYDEVNGLKRVHITLQSAKHRRLRLNYRIAWFDANGMEIDPGTKTYRNVLLEGRDSVTVTGVANSAAGLTSKLRVRDLEAAD